MGKIRFAHGDVKTIFNSFSSVYAKAKALQFIQSKKQILLQSQPLKMLKKKTADFRVTGKML